MTPELERLSKIAAEHIAEYDSECGSETAAEIAPRLVRAILTALREPTEGMVEAARWEDGEHTAKAVWRAMIDHILGAAPNSEG